MITQGELHALLDYELETGVFRWKIVKCYGLRPGDVAGWHSGKGAWRINVAGRQYLAHRLAWFYAYGFWPKQIDHIDGDRTNNRLSNLREANNSQNQANQGPKSNNKLGIRGVSYRRGWYIVQLRKNGFHYTRKFKLLEHAISDAKAMSQKLHGEFSVFNRN